MAKDKRINAKGRRTEGTFVALPYAVMNHPNFLNLSPIGAKLLLELCSQLRMKKGGTVNNGDLCVAWQILRLRGWGSKGSISRARDELLHYGFINMTRAGDIKRPALFALTFFAVDECGGKLDCKPTPAPSNDWRKVVDKYERGNSCGTKQGRKKKNRPYFRSLESEAVDKTTQYDLKSGRSKENSDLKQGPFSESPCGYVVQGGDCAERGPPNEKGPAELRAAGPMEILQKLNN